MINTVFAYTGFEKVGNQVFLFDEDQFIEGGAPSLPIVFSLSTEVNNS
jgi:hypothetical protein